MDTRLFLLWGRNLALMILAIIAFFGIVIGIALGPRLILAGLMVLALLGWLCYISYKLASEQRDDERRASERVMDELRREH